MNELQARDFATFFKAIYGYDPFPWQRMLVERVAEHGWPEGIDLPTASGKTACIDAAVFLLAMGERKGRLPLNDPARRRVFFVVDRRIVVDEAFERAKRLAAKLGETSGGIVKEVADRLHALAGPESSEPLIACRLRGGTVKDERWRLSPAQPAVITSTVDQLGSRLLFRSYGSSNLSAPIEAALTACDSLVLLDEAHCAVPFMQTARAVQRYASEKWAEGDPIVSPLTFSILSATLPEDVKEVFPKTEERDAALDHPKLRRRITAAKPAVLIEAKDTGDSDEKLIAEAVQQAQQSVENGRCRIAIMVNRVARASAIEAELCALAGGDKSKLNADVVLMTGRMRPIDRDQLVYEWRPRGIEPNARNGGLQHWIGATEKPVELPRPIILVTTQCLEVGADFSFDALITECASLDALRQRFGRLNRLGEYDSVDAVVMIRKSDIGGKADDPIYGAALKQTWDWLNQLEHLDEHGRFDFSITALDALLPNDREARTRLTAPSPDAPVLLPAHVDLLCQTAPRPSPDPDVAIFLHGPRRNVPEARVVFRTDLVETSQEDWQDTWCDAVSLLPPLTAEALTLPLWLIQKWLATREKPELGDLSDVESQQSDGTATEADYGQPFIIWRGRQNSVVSRKPQDIRPHQTIVVPASERLAEKLGHAFCRPNAAPLDVAEQAYPAGRGQYILRLLPAVYKQERLPEKLAEAEPLKTLLAWATDDNRENGDLNDLLDALKQHVGDDEAGIPALPDWLRETVEAFIKRRPRIERYPAGGLILLGKPEAAAPLDLDFGDMDDALSTVGQPVSLPKHTEHVKKRAEAWARRCLPESFVDQFVMAAELHDLGKADPRWQQVQMHGGKEELAAVALAKKPPHIFAKSNYPPLRGSAYIRACEQAGMPPGFRHEMLSMQLVEAANGQLLRLADLRELVLHVIATHHGHGRPFAPVRVDKNPPDVEVGEFKLSAEHRRDPKCVPPHRLDSGVADRFWKLTRRYGWWGLAYLESILRLADHAASAAEAAASSPK